MHPDHKDFLRTAFEQYLDCLDEGALEPDEAFLLYDYEFIDRRKWPMMSGMMIKCELRELTNNINHWKSSLYKWHAWNKVLSRYDEDKSWQLRSEFLESLAHDCLLQPSATRDTLVSVATNAIHQIRLFTEQGYQDFLEGDRARPDERPKHLNRRQREDRLKKLASQISRMQMLVQRVRDLDSPDYRSKTSDYRNLNSHTIGPRLGIGQTRTVTRMVDQASELVDIGGGRFEDTLIPNKMQVGYGFGGTDPLNLDIARTDNLQQFRVAVSCYEIYRGVLEQAATLIPLREKDA